MCHNSSKGGYVHIIVLILVKMTLNQKLLRFDCIILSVL